MWACGYIIYLYIPTWSSKRLETVITYYRLIGTDKQ